MKTYWIEKLCDEPDPCYVAAILDEYGRETPHLYCLPHGEPVGYVSFPDAA